MGRFLIYLTTLTIGSLALSVSILAYNNFWFWQMPELDLIVHFLTGLTIGLLSLIVYFSIVIPTYLRFVFSFSSVFLVSFIAVFVVGVIWELFEFSLNEFDFAFLSAKQFEIIRFGWLDTVGDLSANFIGALVASLIFWFNWRVENTKELKSDPEINNFSIND